MKFFIFFIIQIVCVFNADAQLNKDLIYAPPEINVYGEIVEYIGSLNELGSKSMISLIKTGKYKSVHIDSRGGEILSAMELGAAIHEKKLDVVVKNLCNSSCANYIFPAGKNKKISNGALVIWHGDARQKNFLNIINALRAKELDAKDEITNDEKNQLRALEKAVAIQDSFYKSLGINGGIARIGQEIDIPVAQWTLTVEAMQKFGINNIDAPDNYGTNEYCSSWLKKHYAKPTAQCLHLTNEAIDSWKLKKEID